MLLKIERLSYIVKKRRVSWKSWNLPKVINVIQHQRLSN